MFKRDHHVRIATVLQSLDAHLLKKQHCLFGDGTAMVLLMNEYRESADIDFLCSDLSGYRELRQLLKGKNSIAAITKTETIKTLSEVRADQYGIRTMLDVGGIDIKFEIVFEGRISLDPPGPEDQICGISILTRLDMVASKLLANSDRWSDLSTYCRDIIDIAMLNPPSDLFCEGIKKATTAYGNSIQRDLRNAISNLKKNPKRLDECMEALNISTVPKALLWQKIRELETKF